MILKVEKGNFAYNKEKTVLKDINFELNQGDVLAILGPNGVGKTTLLKCIMNIHPWTDGHSMLDEKFISRLSEKELWQNVAYVPQAKNLAFSYTAEEMVLLGRSAYLGLFSRPGKKDYRIAQEAMESIGIAHLRKKSCNQMSGGELQMVLIARALASKPKILILDEPESNLDFKNQLVILDTIKNLSAHSKISCIFNTHYPDHALQVSTHSLILNRDLSNFYGKSTQIINRDTLKKSFGVHVFINDTVFENKKYQHIIPLSIVTG